MLKKVILCFAFFLSFPSFADIEKNIDVRFIELMPIGVGSKFDGVSNDEIRQLINENYKDIVERIALLHVTAAVKAQRAVIVKCPANISAVRTALAALRSLCRSAQRKHSHRKTQHEQYTKNSAQFHKYNLPRKSIFSIAC